QGDSVVYLVVFRPDGADEHSRTRAEINSQLLDGRAARSSEGRLAHQVFRRIAAYIQLGQDKEVDTLISGISARTAELRHVAGDVPEDRVELGQRNRERTCGCVRHSRKIVRA